MNVLGAKLLTGSLFFLVAMCFSLLPFWIIRRFCLKRRTTLAHHSAGQQMLVVQCLYSLASGVLIGTCLIHLLPESLESFQEAIQSRDEQRLGERVNLTDSVRSGQDSGTGQYPLAELLVALGFLVVYMLDNGIKSCSKDGNATNFKDIAIKDEGRVLLSTDECISSQNTAACDTDIYPPGRESEQKLQCASNSRLHHILQAVTFKMSRTTTPYTAVAQTEEEAGEERLASISDCNSLDHLLPSRSSDSLPGVNIQEADSSVSAGHTQDTAHNARSWATSGHLRSAALVAALCVHAFFDGIIVGLQTSVSVVLALAVAISLHKSFVSVGLSLSLLRLGGRQASAVRVSVCAFLFAVASPLGMLVSGAFLLMFGTAITNRTPMTPACLQTFAVGTFLYVAVLEATERQQSKTLCVELVKQTCLLLGFGLMATLRAVAGDS